MLSCYSAPLSGGLYADQEILTNSFHVTHFGGCAVLFNKDIFFPDVKVTSIYLHEEKMICRTKCVKETQAGSYKTCYHVPIFGDNLPAAKNHSQ